MPDVPIKHTGDILYAWEVNEIARQAGMSLTGMGASVEEGPGGKTIVVDTPIPIPDQAVLLCHGDQDMLQFSAVVLLDAQNDGITPLYELPKHCGYAGVGIAESPLDVDVGGQVRRGGMGWLCYNATFTPIVAYSPVGKRKEVVPGDRLGVVRLQQYAEWDQSGPYEVIWSFEQLEDFGPADAAKEQGILTRAGWPATIPGDDPHYRLALVRIQRRERGAGVRCVQQVSGAGMFFGNFYSIEIGTGAHLRETLIMRNGVIEVRIRGY